MTCERRVESPRLIARLVRMLGDVDTAEEIAQGAFVIAIEKWRVEGVPANPAAWLRETARFLAVDRIRRRDTQRGKYRQIAVTTPHTADGEVVDGDLADDLLGLIFMVCHPMLSPDARSALTLKLICGLRTEESRGRSWCPHPRSRSESGARNAPWSRRASASSCRRARNAGGGWMRSARSSIWVFNEGHTATSCDDWIRRDL